MDKPHRVPESNYRGFPMGISGPELSNRAFVQAEKFGAHIAIAQSAKGLKTSQPRVASAVGEGSMVIQFVHKVLAA